MPRAELQAVIDADNKPFIKAMQQSVVEAKRTGKEVTKAWNFKSAFQQQGKELLATFTAGAAAGAVLGFTKEIVNMGGELQDAADKLNISTDALQGLGFAFSQSGASQEDFEKGMVKLNGTIADAVNGNDEVLAKFGRLGVTFDDLKKKSPDEILLMLADGMKEARNPTQALSDVVDLLGKSGQKMAAGLRQGSEEIEQLAKSAAKLTGPQIAQLDAVGDAFAAAIRQAKVFGAQLLLLEPPAWLAKLKPELFLAGQAKGHLLSAPDFPKGFQGEAANSLPGDNPTKEKANLRSVFAEWDAEMIEKEEREKKLQAEINATQVAALVAQKREGETIIEMLRETEDINNKVYEVQRESDREAMDSAQLLVSLEKERLELIRKAKDLRYKDLAEARLEVAKLDARIKQLKVSGPKTAAQSFFDASAEEMRDRMMREAGLGAYSGSTQRGGNGSNWVFQGGSKINRSTDPKSLAGRGVGASSDPLSRQGAGLYRSTQMDDAYGRVRRGDHARAKRAATEAEKNSKAIQATADNTGKLLQVWTGGGGKT